MRTPTSESVAYDIPASALDDALTAYAAQSQIQVLYDSRLTSGRTAARVYGPLTRKAALSALLGPLKLEARATPNGGITIVDASLSAPASVPALIHSTMVSAAALQSSMLRALCAGERTRPGTYRAALQIWLSPNGAVTKAALLATTGDVERDASILLTMRTLKLKQDTAPLPVPFTMVIVPAAGGERTGCEPFPQNRFALRSVDAQDIGLSDAGIDAAGPPTPAPAP